MKSESGLHPFLASPTKKSVIKQHRTEMRHSHQIYWHIIITINTKLPFRGLIVLVEQKEN